MTALRFPSEEALRVALTSGLVPPEVASAPAFAVRAADGSVLVAGAETAELPADARRFSCWAELVAMRRARAVDDGQIVFVLPDAPAMLSAAGEMLRLGCDRQELRRAGDTYLLRVASPPYYTLARALDRVSGVRAFRPGRDRVFLEAGWDHPLADRLTPEEGRVVFLSPDRAWTSLPDGPWTDIYAIVDLVARGAEEARELTSSDSVRLRVEMRLARGSHTDVPSLWVVRDDAPARIERLLASVPDGVADGLLFAVTRGTPPVVVLRARPGARAAAIDVEGEPYRPHLAIPNLFIPCGTSLEPPLRRDKVRELFAPDPDTVSWIRGSGAELRVERMREDAFRPLEDFVDYVIDAGAAELEAWVRGATFEFAAFRVEAQPQAPPEPPRDPPPRERPTRERTRAAEPARPAPARPAERAPEREVVVPAKMVESAAAAELARREKEFLALDGAADDPRRLALWREIGALNARLGRPKEAALALTRALWDASPDEAGAIAAEWVRAESAPDAERLLAKSPATPEDARALAARLAQGDRPDPGRASLWLDDNGDPVDVRSAWLARAAIARLAGGDALGLARARDRALRRLHRGLSIEHDVPTFLRFLGGAREPAQVERLAAALDALLAKVEKTRRARSTVEADPKLTIAYATLVVAYGAARLGRSERARALVARAAAALDVRDPVHGFLAAAYAARVAQALEGLPPETPLPPEIAARLNALDKLSRYKVDRVRQFSWALEPHERLDPIVAFHRGEPDPRGAEFAELRGTSDVAVIEAALEKILAKARAAPPEERARLFDGAMDFFPMIRTARALQHLEEVVARAVDVAPPRRAQLLEEALMLSGHLGDAELGRRVFRELVPLVAGLGVESAAEIAKVSEGMLRTLRRVGLREEAAQLLETMQKAAAGSGAAAMIARLHTASALAYLGRFESAKGVFEETLGVLAGELAVPQRLDLTRAFARGVVNAPAEYALAALEKLAGKLASVTDSFNTNSHLCLSVVAFVESIVLGYASDDLTMGDIGRRWLDDDEYLIRRRIQRDMTEAR